MNYSELEMTADDPRVILATDCGSTTSKARLFRKIGNEYRYVTSGEAPTTVENPYEDVTMGVRNAIREVEELTGYEFLSPEGVITPNDGNKRGTDLYVTTSSAGGGLQMIVSGAVKIMTAESAERAALGAGAIVMDVLSIDDGRRPYSKIKKLRELRPDMILLAGGTDGGTVTHVTSLAEIIERASPKSRLGKDYRLPIVYAGNKDARDSIKNILGKGFALEIVDNIRPTLEVEKVEGARDAIHVFFMEHVMSHAPGYDKLMKWTSIPILPTPAAEGHMFRLLSEMFNVNLIGVGLGGATTNVYSVYLIEEEGQRKFVRTVSANLGMSYSICNVLKEASAENILRWLPFEIDKDKMSNSLRNKMIRPTTIPQTLKDLMIEHAVGREALRLGMQHHRSLSRGLRGVRRAKSYIDINRDASSTNAAEESYIDMMNIDVIAGTGGLLSHAPNRGQSALILMDGFEPEGVTQLYQDSVFMIPHLGVLSTVHPKIAIEIFDKDCLVRLGTCIAPKGTAKQEEEKVITVISDGFMEDVHWGEIKVIPCESRKLVDVELKPSSRFDVGKGAGREFKTRVEGGEVGIIIDARGRPLMIPENTEERRKKLVEWFDVMNAYSQDALKSNSLVKMNI